MTHTQAEFREMPAGIANNTLRAVFAEAVAELLGTRRRVCVLVLIALLTGLVGPFGTDMHFLEVQRYLYWALIVFGTAIPVQLVFFSVERVSRRMNWSALVWVPIASVVAALPAMAVVNVIACAFGSCIGRAGMTELYLQCAVVILSIGTMVKLLSPREAIPIPAPSEPVLLHRLPGARRGQLIRLAAQDHYVEVITDQGRSLVAMRFKDAIEEAGQVGGAQVHRSHWVAREAVVARRTVSGKVVLELTDGSLVPIGRTFRRKASDAGVLF
ncbi:LytTR family DNA-binding domain-containing protein [uncultured Roseobacter sp.]|uniref:LytTR family DNA-binding domain-containing protein n=1 Tax=uncultured Roseobacter sp. TaxID=114847 RepID=UPI002623096C|nr:LytTR family DNA-binding domain-containing protein [uncultured Roseobacter sp.]